LNLIGKFESLYKLGRIDEANKVLDRKEFDYTIDISDIKYHPKPNV
jgi:hypothetical protein